MNRKEFEKWLKGQSREMSAFLAARIALRVLPFACKVDRRWDSESVALLTLRAILTSSVASTTSIPRIVEKAIRAAGTAADAAVADDDAAQLAVNATRVATLAVDAAKAANASVRVFTSALSAADTIIFRLFARARATNAPETNTFKDSEYSLAELRLQPLWHTPDEPDFLKDWRRTNQTHLDAPEFSFWKRLYEGFVAGRPIAWELQRRVALIDETIWEKGAQAVADEIARIEAEFRAEQSPSAPRFPQYEPSETAQLWDNSAIYAMSSVGAYSAIKRDIDALHAEGINQFPEHFEPMKSIGVSSFRISGILTSANRNEATDIALKQEIGRLTALVISQAEEIGQLRAELDAALKAGTKDELGPQIAASVKSFLWAGAGLGAAISTVWALSGSDVRLEERVKNLQADRDYILEFFDFDVPVQPDPFFAPSVEV